MSLTRAALVLSLFLLRANSTPVSIPLGSVSDLLIQSALDSLNDNSPTHHTYKSGSLISAQKLVEAPYVIYRLTLNLEPNCNEEACPREACAIDLRQHEQGVIDVEKSSIQCMYLYPQSSQDEIQQHVQENVQDKTSLQETESLDKQIANDSVQLDHEVEPVVGNGSERPFIAVRATERNYCAGCPYELNPTLPGLAAFGEQVVQSMDDSGRSDFKHKVVSIVRVTRAVPPGSNVVQYELHLEIGETNCPRSSLVQRSECTLLTNIPIKLCLVTFEERPWQRNTRKMIRNNCTESLDSDNELNSNYEPNIVSESLATSLSSTVRESTPQANTRTELSDDIAFASSIDAFFDNSESAVVTTESPDRETREPITEVSITKVVLSTENGEKGVTGFSEKIKEFDEFLHDFDIPIKNITPQPENHGIPVTEEHIRPEVVLRPCVQSDQPMSSSEKGSRRTRRSLVDTPKAERALVRKLAQKALNVLDDIDVDNNKRVVLGVLDSKKEERDGTVYHVTMKVAPTDCDEKHKRVADCLDGIREPAKICKVQIHTDSKRPLETAKVLQLQCFLEPKKWESRVRRELFGAPIQKGIDDPEIRAYVETALNKFSETSNSENEPLLVEIKEATAQVVSGMLYKIKVKFGESTCAKGNKLNCQLKENSDVTDYLITVWSQPWLDKGKPDIKVELHSDKEVTRVRRASIPGGTTQKSPNDPEIRAYAEKGLGKFSETSNSANEPFLIEILEATQQVVSGMLYKIKVRLGESTCSKGNNRENCQLKENSDVTDYLITVWSQPWLDNGNPDIKVELYSDKQVTRVRRASIPGGTTQKSPNDPEIRAYAEKGLGKFSETSNSANEPFLIEILEATQQVVSGMLYKIKVRLGESTCSKGNNKENCQLKENSDVTDYLITVWSQPWLDNGNPDIKVELYSDKQVTRVRRASIPGGTTQKSPNDPEIRAYAEKGLGKFSETSNSANEPFLIEILEATQQVVSGMLYKIKVRLGESTCPKGNKENCQLKENSDVTDYLITVWSQPWLDNGNPDIKVELYSDKQVTRVRRASIPGGTTQKSPNDPEIRAYAEKGLGKFSETSNSANEPFLIEILEATQQVVSGMLYKIKVRLGESTCPKGNKENCQLKENSDVTDYLITVWSQPWLDKGNPDIKIELHSENQEKRVRRSVGRLGGTTEKSPNDPEIRAYAEKGLRKFSEIFDTTSEPFLIDILEATEQVVSGMLYKIKVRLGESTCSKGNSGNCQLKKDSDVKDYVITVWSQPWVDHGNPDIKIKEHTEQHGRHRRSSAPGENKKLSPNDPEIQVYAQQGIRKFSESLEGTYEYVLVEITEASVKTVSGQLYKIKAKLGESNCPKGTNEGCQFKADGEIKDCLIVVWSQPWIDKGDPAFKVQCSPPTRQTRSLRGVNYSEKMLKLHKNIGHERAFEDFILKYEKVYASEEEKNTRFEVFKKNMKIIERLRENEQGTAEYGASIFADITPEEFRAKYTGLRPELRSENHIPFPRAKIPDIELPKEFDWRHYNVVTEVKNQGQCGSCWAFAVTGNVEGLYAIKMGKLLSLSEQELVDCDKLDQGCEGGLPDNAYRAIESLGGLELETDYPYDGEDEKCHFDKSKARVNIVSGLNITSNETGMAQWLVKNGPISVGINANAMQFYMGGVSHPFKFLCSGNNLDHGVLIVGYGIHTYPIFNKSMPYWIIKNSWGPSWGEQGYYRVYRGDGTCGLNRMATSAVLG